MTSVIHRTINTPIPQSQPLDDRQVPNAAGGYVYEVGLESAFDRFLILGTSGGTFYASESKLTREGMAVCARAARDLSPGEYATHVINAAETAPKRTYALYAIAVALIEGSTELRQKAPDMAANVCKTGTDVFELASYVKGQRGWGSTVKATFDRFLVGMDETDLALWAVKYRSRHGWTWRDLLRMQHPAAPNREALFGFMVGKTDPTGMLVVDGFLRAQHATEEHEVLDIVTKYGLPWEALTDEQRTPAVWKACLPNIGNWAVVRNLANFTRLGLTDDRSFALAVEERIAGARRVHPVTVLEALRTYGSGGSLGRSTAVGFRPLPLWLSALEGRLNDSFTDGVETIGQNVYVGLDVSSSMGAPVSGSYVLSCRDVGAALSLAFVKNEPWAEVNAFSDGASRGWGVRRGDETVTNLGWNQRTTFTEAINQTTGMLFGGTDCALPMIDAIARKQPVDTFIVVTDNETWFGNVHPMQALKDYRKISRNPKARLAVVALTSPTRSIADPADPYTMDFVGFSSDLPKALAAFMKMD